VCDICKKETVKIHVEVECDFCPEIGKDLVKVLEGIETDDDWYPYSDIDHVRPTNVIMYGKM